MTWLESLLSGALVAFTLLAVGFLSWIVRKLAAHDTALALLVQQVNPPGDKSLRELLHDIQLEQARETGAQKVLTNPAPLTRPSPTV